MQHLRQQLRPSGWVWLIVAAAVLAASAAAPAQDAAPPGPVTFYVPFDGSTRGYDGEHVYPNRFFSKGRLPVFAYEKGVLGQAARFTWEHGYPGALYAAAHTLPVQAGTLSVWVKQSEPFYINSYYPKIWVAEGPLVAGIFSGRLDPRRAALPLKPLNDEAFKEIAGDGQWHHHVITWDAKANERKQYLDGKLIAEGTYAPKPPQWFTQAGPGQALLRFGYRHTGWLDELAILQAAASAEQVQALHAAYKAGQQPLAVPERKGEPVYPLDLGGKLDARPAGPGEATAALGERTDISPTRAGYSLAGLWRFQPVYAGDVAPRANDWAYLKVPGTWLWNGDKPGQIVTATGTKVGDWAGRPLGDARGAWLERDINVPAAWKGKTVLLTFPWVRADQEPLGSGSGPRNYSDVYLNGQYVASVETPGTLSVPVSRFLHYGRTNRLTVLNGRPYTRIHPADRRARPKAGLTEAPRLEIRDAPGYLAGRPIVTPSTRNKTLTVELPIRNLTDAALTLHVTAALAGPINVQGQDKPKVPDELPMVRLAARQAVTLAAGFDGTKTVVLDARDLATWTPDDPNLYRISLEITPDGAAKASDVTPPERFGYRELWVEDGHIYLNGRRLLVRGASHNYLSGYGFTKREIRLRKMVGQNSDRTQSPKREHFHTLDDCDEEGWMVWFTANPIGDPKTCRQVWNHPSVVAWGLTGNGYITGPHGHPISLGKEVPEDVRESDEHFQLCRQIRRRDPARITGWYRSGAGGDFRSIMHYMGWGTPIQTIEEWVRHWAEHRPAAFMPMELSLMMPPLENVLWQRGRNYSVLTEHAARYLGAAAYEMTDPALIELTKPDANARNVSMSHPLHWATRSLIYRRALRAWRTYRMSGWLLHIDGKIGSTHVVNKLNPFGEAMARNNEDVLFYLAGPTDDFVAKDHAFTAGEQIAKTAVVCNDRLAGELKGRLTWHVTDANGQKLAGGDEQVTIEQGGMLMHPLRLRAPDVRARTALTLAGTFTSADRKVTQTDEMALEVWPKQPTALRKWAGKVAVIDTHGDTTAVLDKMGVPYTLLSRDIIDRGQQVSGFDLLVIGRNSYPEAAALIREGFMELDGLISGGMHVVVLSQMSRKVMGLRTENYNNRYAFIVDGSSPLLRGLSNADLHDWRGAASALPPYQPWDADSDWRAGKASKHGQWNAFQQLRNWHWSNKGMVATFCYAKPQAGNFRVLLESGFDNLYTPLIELRRGKGRVLLSQLELVPNVGADPVASRLLGRIVRHYGAARPAEAAGPVACLGEDGDRIELQAVRAKGKPGFDGDVLYLTAEQLAALDGARARKVEKFLSAGGTVLSRLAADAALPRWLAGGPATVETKRMSKMPADDHPLLAGLGPSDFFWRWGAELPAITKLPGGQVLAGGLIGVRPHGKGRLVLVQAPPDLFAADEATQWQHTKLLRIYATVLTNLGVASTAVPQAGDAAGKGAVKEWLLGDRNRQAPKELVSPTSPLYVHPALDFDPERHHVW